MANGFGQSFTEAFQPAFARSQQAALDSLRQEQKQRIAERKLLNRARELQENDLLYDTPEGVASKINELNLQGIEATAKFDPELQRFVIDTAKKGQVRKPSKGLLPTLDDVKKAAGGNLFEAEFVEDPETGDTGFTFKVKKSEGATTENTKELNNRLNKLSNLGGDITREELSAFTSIPEKIDFVNSKISSTVSEKKTAAQEKREFEKLDLRNETESLVDLFTEATQEAKTASPIVGKSGLSGRVAGGAISQQARFLGETIGGRPLPNVNAYNASRKAFATIAAKAAGEVRPTDQDINRFMDTLPSISLSDAENRILIEQLKEKTKDKNSLAKSWLDATGKSVPQIETENTFKQKDTITDIRPTGTIIETTKGKFEFVGIDKETGKKKYRKVG